MNWAAKIKHPEERVGDTLLGKWRLDELLGIGAMAVVFSATHRNGKRVAIKMLHQHLMEDSVIVQRFLREGYAANLVGHPAVVSALDDNLTEDGCPFLVLDLIEGRPLDLVLAERGSLPCGEVLAIADQVLDALVAAHDKGVLHRDLKPENLVLTTEGTVRILDFGIARIDSANPQDPRLTVPGRALGTPGFMAPEQAQGFWDRVDARTDLWSLGATMFALLTGREPHAGGKAHELLIAAMTKPAQPINELLPDLPDAVASLVDRALAFEPGKRFPSARVMQEWVRDAHQLLPSPTPSSSATADLSAPSRSDATPQSSRRGPAVAPRDEGPRGSRASLAKQLLVLLLLSAALTLAARNPTVRRSAARAVHATRRLFAPDDAAPAVPPPTADTTTKAAGGVPTSSPAAR